MLPLFDLPMKSSMLVLTLLSVFTFPARAEIALQDFKAGLQLFKPSCQYDTKEFYVSPQVGTLYQMYLEGQFIGDKPQDVGFQSFLCEGEEATLYYYRFSTASAAHNMLSYVTSFVWGETEAPSDEHPEAVILSDNIIVVVSGRNVESIESRTLENFAAKKWLAISIGRVFSDAMRLLEDKNYVKALEQFLVLAKLDHLGAQNNLCVLYNETEQFSKALHWCARAAQLGQKAAQYVLGSLYWSGRGTAKNEKQGLYWWRQAAQAGFAPALYKLALLYESGNIVEQNTQTALEYYRQSADSGFTDAQVRLAQIFLSGEIVKPDLQEALNQLQAASLGGNSEAMSMLNYLNEHMVADITAAALDAIENKLHCEKPSQETERFACDSLADFRQGQYPDIRKIDRKRLVGVAVAFNNNDVPTPYFELSGLELRQQKDIGDKLYKFHATATEPGEADLITAAVQELRLGKIPKDNFAYKFVLTSEPPNEPSIALKGVSGTSLGSIDGGFRVLLREHNNTLVGLELHPMDDEILAHRFYFMRYSLRNL